MQNIITEMERGRIKIKPPYLIIKPEVTEEEYFKMTNEDSNCELFEGKIIKCKLYKNI